VALAAGEGAGAPNGPAAADAAALAPSGAMPVEGAAVERIKLKYAMICMMKMNFAYQRL
jgi:hypothetical protein